MYPTLQKYHVLQVDMNSKKTKQIQNKHNKRFFLNSEILNIITRLIAISQKALCYSPMNNKPLFFVPSTVDIWA